jgi:hypothetical protein
MSYVILRKWCSKYIMDILLKEKKMMMKKKYAYIYKNKYAKIIN